MKKAIIIGIIFLANIILLQIVFAGNYGNLNYGQGSYSTGETSSTETTPASSESASSGGGGGGGGGGGKLNFSVVTDFSVDKNSFKVFLKQGETKNETITIKNTGTSIFDIEADLSSIAKFKDYPKENQIVMTLRPKEEKWIEIIFKALSDETPDIYPAKITLKSPSKEKSVASIVEVDSAQPLFDVDVEVHPETKKIFPGDEVLLEVNLFNVRGFGRVDVNVEYAIKDFEGNVLAAEHETLAAGTQAKFTRALLVPSDLAPGSYVALVKVNYADSVGTSSDIFEVKAKSITLSAVQLKDYGAILLGAAIIAVLAVFALSAYQFGYLKRKSPKGIVEEIKQFKGEEKVKKLRKELKALEQARKSGFISEVSYLKDRKRIENRLKRQ